MLQSYEVFWGSCQFQLAVLSRFCDYLRKLTRQGAKWCWDKEENEAFEALKNQLAEVSMMTFYDKQAPTEVVTDASPV